MYFINPGISKNFVLSPLDFKFVLCIKLQEQKSKKRKMASHLKGLWSNRYSLLSPRIQFLFLNSVAWRHATGRRNYRS